MNDSQNPDDDGAGADEASAGKLGGDGVNRADEGEGLSEPSAEELLVEDGEWDEARSEQEGNDDESSLGLPSPGDLGDSEESGTASDSGDGEYEVRMDEDAFEADAAEPRDDQGTSPASEGRGEQAVEPEPEVAEVPKTEEAELGAPPSLPKQPDDVKGSRESPDQQLEFRSGDRVGGRFVVERYLGSSGGGISYLCREDDSGNPVVIKVLTMPAPRGEHLEWMRGKIRAASQIRAANTTDILGMGTTGDGEVYVAMDYIEGQSLSRALATQREKGREIGLAEMYHVVEHICNGLEAIHEHLAHGLLTPFNIYIGDSGQVQIQNLGFGEISARYLHSEGKGPFRDSIYVAPEVTADPDNLSPRSDLYSAGMIAAEMLSGGGLPRQRGRAREVAARIAKTYSDGIHRLVGASLSKDPSERTGSTAEFRMALENAVEEAGVDPADGLPSDGLPVRPAVDVREGDDELFDIPGPEQSEEVDTAQGEERYLVRKEGLDYGPFTKQEVLDQLYDDEIDEHTSVLNRAARGPAWLG